MAGLENLVNGLLAADAARVSRPGGRYPEGTPPETVRADYDKIFAAAQAAGAAVLAVAQGKKYFNQIDPVDYYGSRDDLSRALKEYPAAVGALYDHDDAAKNYSANNLEMLIAMALQDMEDQAS